MTILLAFALLAAAQPKCSLQRLDACGGTAEIAGSPGFDSAPAGALGRAAGAVQPSSFRSIAGRRRLCDHSAMPRNSPFRLTWLALVAVAGPAGVFGPEEGVAARGSPGRCGIRAAMDSRQPETLREKPPACALPTGREVGLSCAVHDVVTSPGYQPPGYDDEGIATGGSIIPEYGVSHLRCRFTNRVRNRALCRFRLSIPERDAFGAAATFEHRFVQDHGPAHHLYGTQWMATGRCVPAGESARPAS